MCFISAQLHLSVSEFGFMRSKLLELHINPHEPASLIHVSKTGILKFVWLWLVHEPGIVVSHTDASEPMLT